MNFALGTAKGAAVCLLLLVPAFSLAAADTDYKIDRSLMMKLADDEAAVAPFFVVFGDRANVKPAQSINDRAARGRYVVQALQATADRSQAGVRGWLRAQGIAFTPFWIENKIYVPSGTLEVARELARRPEVAAILPEVIYTIPKPLVSSGASVNGIEWNISKIGADQVWSNITQGAGIVVANIDTGVQYNHPALVLQYRGNTGSTFSHAGNWYDPTGRCGATPCDNDGHGTHTMGTMVGSDGSNRIGVAPGARWIACKGCASSSCASSSLIACAQWIMDPMNNQGLARPDVVNNSWGGGGGNSWYQSYLLNWRAAGIFPAFSVGNSGPKCGTAGSPGDYRESFASGATDSNDLIASWSSRGPSAFGVLKPDVSAPGVSIRSSVPTNSYAVYSGTSMASPHTAGAVALIWAASGYRANIGATEQVIKAGAFGIATTQTCGGLSAGAIPNDTYGSGRINALVSVNKARGTFVNQPPTVAITSPGNGASFSCPATVSFTGTASDPENGNLTGSIAWQDNGGPVFGAGGSVSKTFACTQAGNHAITATVKDADGLADSDTITITILQPVPSAPSNLTASARNGTVTLKWKDNSTNETNFLVERKSGTTWSRIQTLGANVTTTADTPGTGTFSYRVSASNSAGTSAPSNVVKVTVR